MRMLSVTTVAKSIYSDYKIIRFLDRFRDPKYSEALKMKMKMKTNERTRLDLKMKNMKEKECHGVIECSCFVAFSKQPSSTILAELS